VKLTEITSWNTKKKRSTNGSPLFSLLPVKDVNHIRCFAIDMAIGLILLSCRLTIERLCVLQLETGLATLVTTWFRLTDCRWRSRYRSSDQCIRNAFRSPERYNGWFREQLGQRFIFSISFQWWDGRCLKFSLKRDGEWEQGKPVCWSFFLASGSDIISHKM
jgi:hypothetical protein